MPFSYDIHCTHPYTGFCVNHSWFYCKMLLWHVYVPNQVCLHLLVFLKPYLLFYISLGGTFYFVSVTEGVFWLCWVFIAVLSLSLVAAHRLWSAGSVAVASGLSFPLACRIVVVRPKTKPVSSHWTEDSDPLHHQGSPLVFVSVFFLIYKKGICIL